MGVSLWLSKIGLKGKDVKNGYQVKRVMHKMYRVCYVQMGLILRSKKRGKSAQRKVSSGQGSNVSPSPRN